jgi:predicted acylesterase/phospholipase RssA
MSAAATGGHDPATSEPPTIGLCLSGGGFRASFYALGVLRYLAEARLLAEQVVAVSAVSGGSIAAAVVADRWKAFIDAGGDGAAFVQHVDAPFRQTVTRKNLRRRWMFATAAAVIPGTGGRGGAYARTLAHNLYRTKRVSDLPHDPQIIFTSTDLSKGRPFWIAAAFSGCYDYGYVEPTPTALPLGKAVAASAAFPPSLTVVTLKGDKLNLPESPPKRLSLVDGGVYDNLGLEWFQGWEEGAVRPKTARKPAFVVVVNASGLLATRDKRFLAVPAIPRDFAIQYQQSLNLRVRWNDDYMRANRGSRTYMSIKSDPRNSAGVPSAAIAGALPSQLVEPLAQLRTDLDRFSADEAGLLSYHGYWTLHARLATFMPHLAVAAPSWSEYGCLSHGEAARLRRHLIIGAHRFGRRLRGALSRGDDT